MSRIYVVTSDKAKAQLVRANTVSQALRHVTEKMFSAEVADQDTLVQLISDGVTVDDATATNITL